MTLPLGVSLLLLGLLASILGAHVKSLRFFDRPTLARSRRFDPALALLKWILILSGLGLIGRASRVTLVAVVALLLLVWGYVGFIHSPFFQRRLLRRDLEALRRECPGLAEHDLLRLLVLRRHPAWGQELIEQMVLDHPTVDSLARIVAKMERGFRGFRP